MRFLYAQSIPLEIIARLEHSVGQSMGNLNGANSKPQRYHIKYDDVYH